MARSFSRWRPKHLIAAWSVYWFALALVTLGPAALAIWQAVNAGKGKGNVSFGFTNTVIRLTVVRDGLTTWDGSASLAYIAALVVGPPLAIWLLWISRRARPVETRDEHVTYGS